MTELTKFKRFFEVITRVNRSLHESKDLETTLQVLVETIADVFEAKGCVLRMLNPEKNVLEVQAATGLSRSYLEKGTILADGNLSEVFDEGLVMINDVANDPRVQYAEDTIKEGISSIIGVPFQVMGSMRMVLRIYFREQLELEEEDQDFIYYMASQSATAIENSLLQSRYLETFGKVSAAIHGNDEVKDILEVIVYHVQQIMEARGCIYWIVDTNRKNIHMKVTSGFQMENLSVISYQTLKDVFQFSDKNEIYIKDAANDERIPSTSKLGKQLVSSILGISFPVVDNYTGILAVYFSRPRHLMQSELDFVRDLARQGAIALHKAFRYDERMLEAFRETIEGLVMALEAKDVCTHGHSLNVANYARLTALEMNLSEKQVDTIYHAGLLHDIGKIALQDTILDNLGNLSRDDFEIVKKHPVIGARIIRPLSFLEEMAPLILHHHERYDGKGYPEGLRAREIPLGARIIAVSDSFDAMTSQRPGTETMSVRKALNLIQEQSGAKFDPEVVLAFVRMIEANEALVTPYSLPENYFTRYESEFRAPEKRRSPFNGWLKKIVPGM